LFRTHKHSDSNKAELPHPRAGVGLGSRGQRRKVFPAILLCKKLSEILVVEKTCQIVNLKHIKTDSAEVGKIDGIKEWSVLAESTGTGYVRRHA
jgi:hypothetical protein